LAIALATNLFYHGTFLAMAHGFLFFDFCLLIWLTIKFYSDPGDKKAFSLGLVIGLIALTRVPEVISVLIPLLWGVTTVKDIKERSKFLRENYRYVVLAGLAFVIVFSLQVAYWYYTSGQLFFDPYEGEGFNFLKPQIWQGWFSFSNGWLIYTPIMGLSLIGWFKLKKYCKDPWLATLVLVVLHVYIHYSYYVWVYYPGFGQRPMIEMYPILSFGLAAFFMYCFRRKTLNWIPVLSVVLFSTLNFFQSWQMRQGIIWAERGNQPFYAASFAKTKWTRDAFIAFDTNERQPRNESLSKINRLYSEDFENMADEGRSTTHKRGGHYSLYLIPEQTDWEREFNLTEVRPNDWLEIGVYGYFERKEKMAKRDLCASLIVQIYDDEGRQRKWRKMSISSHIGNSEYSIWTTGKPEIWGQASFFIKMPRRVDSEWKMKISLENPHGQKIYLDDLYVSQHRR